MNISLIITAGGTSSRYGNKNKLLEKIDSKTVIEHAVGPFFNFQEITQMIISANISIKDDLENIFKNTNIQLIEGGKTRQESVYKALQITNGDYVIIHDGARPLVTEEIVKQVIESVKKYHAVSAMVKTTDTIKEVDDSGKIIRTIDRKQLYNTQTPQAFKTDIIREAHKKLSGKSYTDDASMLEEFGTPVYIVQGDSINIKITSKSDLDFAKLYI